MKFSARPKHKDVPPDRGCLRSALFLLAFRKVASVSSDKTKPPVRIDLKTGMFEYIIKTSRIGKCEIFNFNHRHNLTHLHIAIAVETKNNQAAGKLFPAACGRNPGQAPSDTQRPDFPYRVRQMKNFLAADTGIPCKTALLHRFEIICKKS